MYGEGGVDSAGEKNSVFDKEVVVCNCIRRKFFRILFLPSIRTMSFLHSFVSTVRAGTQEFVDALRDETREVEQDARTKYHEYREQRTGGAQQGAQLEQDFPVEAGVPLPEAGIANDVARPPNGVKVNHEVSGQNCVSRLPGGGVDTTAVVDSGTTLSAGGDEARASGGRSATGGQDQTPPTTDTGAASTDTEQKDLISAGVGQLDSTVGQPGTMVMSIDSPSFESRLAALQRNEATYLDPLPEEAVYELNALLLTTPVGGVPSGGDSGADDVDAALDAHIAAWEGQAEIEAMFSKLVLEDELNFLSREEFWRRYLWRYWRLKGDCVDLKSRGSRDV